MNPKLMLLLLLGLAASALAHSTKDDVTKEADLGSYYINPKWVHTSGISAGAFFAVQFALAFSESVHGAGAIAGGPYYCARASLSTALTSCMSTPAGINVNTLVKDTQSFEASGKIDSLENLKNHKNYIFHGLIDATVNPLAGEKLLEFWLNFQNASMIKTEFSLSAGHSHVTDDYGNSCSSSRSPYINNCNYDTAGIMLQHFYGNTLKPRTTPIEANLFTFDQSLYRATSFQKNAFVYVPTACQKGELCGLHIAFHGCLMNSDDVAVGKKYVLYAGYNDWAEANNIIILYPQASSSVFPSNPNACFDWWGYAGTDYAVRSGSQMAAVKKMMEKLMAGNPILPAPAGLSATEITNSTVTLVWQPVSGATGYSVHRNGAQITSSPITSTTFTDSGLTSGTTFEYTVAALVTGGSSPHSSPLVVKTTGPPPPLAAPVLRVGSVTSTSATLSWDSVAGAAGYSIRRNGVAVTNVTSLSFVDSGLAPETSYTYSINAFGSGSEVGPDSNAVTITTGSSWVCQGYYDNNYNHVGAGRAYQKLGYVYAQGSDEYMGLYNIATYTRLAETSKGYFVVGECN